MRTRIISTLLAGCAFAALTVPALAGDFLDSGDGSLTDNPDLLRGAYECGYDCPAGVVPREPFNPPFDLDWSIALRGAYVSEGGVSSFETSVVPSVAFHRDALRSTLDLTSEAEIIVPQGGQVRLGALRFSSAFEYGLTDVMNFAFDGDLSITQAPPSDPANPAGTASSPVIVDGDLDATLTRDIGIAYIGLRGTVGRSLYGETTLANATVVDNSASNTTRYGGGLRLSHRLTPIIMAFADASAVKSVYDAASPTLLVKLDGVDYVLRGGLAADVGNILSVEASAGVALRKFDDASIADVQAAVYGASVTFRPDETLTLTGTAASTIEAPGYNSPGTAAMLRTASLETRYKVNSWWTVWASGGWSDRSAVGAASTETTLSIAAGSEYLLNRFVALTADYSFSRRTITASPVVDTHKATVGVKIAH